MPIVIAVTQVEDTNTDQVFTTELTKFGFDLLVEWWQSDALVLSSRMWGQWC